ncbi:MAG: DUF411 domain-containing protein [Henriciella sp.]|uniref:DUF411 domain-containing protein n=1 Tax=Henriciella sp. TaxID=1968823 RepID=UPI003C767B20
MRRFLTLALMTMMMPVFAWAQSAMLYRSPTCGCCLGHADYLREQGFEVEVVELETEALAYLKAEQTIPRKQQGCHTIMIEGYVVEGHVPVDAINKLLAERPDIKGIALPGMPMGSPGMGGEKTAPFAVMVIGEDDEVFAVI